MSILLNLCWTNIGIFFLIIPSSLCEHSLCWEHLTTLWIYLSHVDITIRKEVWYYRNPTFLKGKYNRNLNPHNFPKTAPWQENKLGLCLKLSNNSTHSSSHLCMIHVASLCAGVHAESLTGLPGTLPMIQAWGIWVEGIAFEKMSAPDWSVSKPVVNFHGWWLMWKGLVHYGACHPWAYGPGVFKKAG